MHQHISTSAHQQMKGIWFRIALLNFTLAALLGAVLRLAFVVEIPGMDFRHVLHAHSHVAMLGWVYLALYAFFISKFLTKEQAQSPYYRYLFWLTQISVAGMLFSFPVQGYGPVSILFSTLHILLSYAFSWRFLNDLKNSPADGSLAARMARAAVWFMLLSTLGTWALGPIFGMGLRGKIGFILAVQFFLHFQVFGWFLFGALALFFRFLDQEGVIIPTAWGKRFLGALVAATVLTFGLVLNWAYASPWTFSLNGLGAVLFLLTIAELLRKTWPLQHQLRAVRSHSGRALLAAALAALALAAVMRGLTIFPAVAAMSYTLRQFTVGFLHLVLLGVVSTSLLAFAMNRCKDRCIPIGTWCFLTGFLGSELLLFGQGVLLWAGMGFFPLNYELLFGLSALIPLGLVFFLFARFTENREDES